MLKWGRTLFLIFRLGKRTPFFGMNIRTKYDKIRKGKQVSKNGSGGNALVGQTSILVSVKLFDHFNAKLLDNVRLSLFL